MAKQIRGRSTPLNRNKARAVFENHNSGGTEVEGVEVDISIDILESLCHGYKNCLRNQLNMVIFLQTTIRSYQRAFMDSGCGDDNLIGGIVMERAGQAC
jgi:hypothetical protein